MSDSIHLNDWLAEVIRRYADSFGVDYARETTEAVIAAMPEGGSTGEWMVAWGILARDRGSEAELQILIDALHACVARLDTRPPDKQVIQ